MHRKMRCAARAAVEAEEVAQAVRAAESVYPLPRRACRVTMHQVELYGITSVELQKRIGIWDLGYYVGRRTLQ